MVLAIVAITIIIPYAAADTCYDNLCWGKNTSSSIRCDQSINHCGYAHDGNPICLPGNTLHSTKCRTDNQFFRCYCNHNVRGKAYCDCKDAITFWAVIGSACLMFAMTQVWLCYHYVKSKEMIKHYLRRRLISDEAHETEPLIAGEQPTSHYGTALIYSDANNHPPETFPPPDAFHSELQNKILQNTEYDNQYVSYNSNIAGPSSAPDLPPAYEEVAGAPAIVNPPYNPYL